MHDVSSHQTRVEEIDNGTMILFTSRQKRAGARFCLTILVLISLIGLLACDPEIEPDTAAPVTSMPATPAAKLTPRAPTISTPSARADPTRAANGAISIDASGAGPCISSDCHNDLKQKEKPVKHTPYVQARCLECHQNFHTRETQRARLQRELDLCYTCHTRQSLGNTHPVGEGVLDPNTQQMMTCTSTCHRSHTAPYPYLLTLPGTGALCVNCHKEFLR